VLLDPSPLAFPRCAKFKGEAMEEVSVDVLPSSAGPTLSSGYIPIPSLTEKAAPGAEQGEIGKLALSQTGEHVLHIWPKY